LREVQDDHVILLDDGWYILKEYMGNLRSEGQPGIGDAFLKWVLTNRRNPVCCEWVHITPASGSRGDESFEEFPDDAELDGFDPADRKFVAVALAHSEAPPILNAVDAGWWTFREALSKYAVQVEFLCPDAMV
jgi:hypothetical protein